MARPLRIEFPGAIYHATCRMIGDWRTEQTHLFKDDADRTRFVGRLADRVADYRIRLYLFVCMTNHFHLVFETPEANCSAFMQSLLTAYTVYYNLRHGRHGHLLDGRFKAKLVEGDEYLLALSRYVHLNPVHVGAMKQKPTGERIRILRKYAWSTYPSYCGKSKAWDFVDYGPVLAAMGGPRKAWPKQYREFVENGLVESDEEFIATLKESPRSLGHEEFCAWVDDLYRNRLEAHARPEDVSFRRAAEPLSVEKVMAVLADVFCVKADVFKRRRWQCPLRAVASRFLIRYAGQTQRNVADLLGIGSGAAVSASLKRLPEKLAGDRALWARIEEAENRLEMEKKRNGREGKRVEEVEKLFVKG